MPNRDAVPDTREYLFGYFYTRYSRAMAMLECTFLHRQGVPRCSELGGRPVALHALSNKIKSSRVLVKSSDNSDGTYLQKAGRLAWLRTLTTSPQDSLFSDAYAQDLAASVHVADEDQGSMTASDSFDILASKFVDTSVYNIANMVNVNRDQEYKQVVLVGDGMCTRFARIPWPLGTVIYLVAPGHVHERAEAILRAQGAKVPPEMANAAAFESLILGEMPSMTVEDLENFLASFGFLGSDSPLELVAKEYGPVHQSTADGSASWWLHGLSEYMGRRALPDYSEQAKEECLWRKWTRTMLTWQRPRRWTKISLETFPENLKFDGSKGDERQAGPSGAGNAAVGKTVEETQFLFNTGVACIKANALEMAADIFAQVLRARTARYGDLATECASSYYRYGAVLLYQAQDNADVFGAQLDTDVHQDVEDKENHTSIGDTMEAGGSAGAGGEDVQTSVGDAKGKEALPETESAQHEHQPEEAAPSNDAEVEATDLEIAWENLDTARAIWEKDPQQNCDDLASVHVLLGDVALENEAFDNALTDYQHALKYQKMANFPEDDRRTAEVYFKRVMALQFLERPEDALVEVESARDILFKKLQNLQASGDDHTSEIEDVSGILDDLKDKRVNWRHKQRKSLPWQMQSGALSHFQKSAAGNQGEMKSQGVDMGGGSNKSNIASPVKDLGVVGRGTKRINLAPSTTDKGKEPAVQAAPGSGVDANSNKKKRSAEDIMGGGGEDTQIGFGNGDNI
eukprot:jgi/Picre1/30235/NNA_005603.t2